MPFSRKTETKAVRLQQVFTTRKNANHDVGSRSILDKKGVSRNDDATLIRLQSLLQVNCVIAKPLKLVADLYTTLYEHPCNHVPIFQPNPPQFEGITSVRLSVSLDRSIDRVHSSKKPLHFVYNTACRNHFPIGLSQEKALAPPTGFERVFGGGATPLAAEAGEEADAAAAEDTPLSPS